MTLVPHAHVWMSAANSNRGSLLLLGPMETERISPRYSGIDVWDPADVLDAMIEGQFAAVAAVRAARPALERAALAMETRLAQRGRLIYSGAGPRAVWPSRTAPS